MATKKETPHRISLSRIVELMLTRPTDHSTISLSRNARGDTEVSVAVRAHGELTVEGAELLAQTVYERLCQFYPVSSEQDEGQASVSLTRNAKGETQIDVGVRGKGEPRDVAGAVRVEYDRLRSAYPMASGFVGAQPESPVEGGKGGGKA